MTIQIQRLIIILLSLILIAGAVILILNNSKKNLIFFYTPSELLESDLQINQKVRIGGFIKKSSINNKLNNSHFITFIITDNEKDIFVEYQGILPDLFREEKGAVAEGYLIKKNKLKAEKVFAKHDENYMPASIKKQLKENQHWNNNYSNEKIPEFATSSLMDETIILSNQDINNKISLINFFASWCAPCKIEHPLFIELKNRFPDLLIIGINYKDKKEDAINFLNKEGNPYGFIGTDYKGNIGLEFDVLVLPKTFLTNKQGEIIFKHVGPITKEIVKNNIIPFL